MLSSLPSQQVEQDKQCDLQDRACASRDRLGREEGSVLGQPEQTCLGLATVGIQGTDKPMRAKVSRLC